MSKKRKLSFRFTPIILTANMKGLVGGSMVMLVSPGSNSRVEVDVQLMICMLTVWMAVLMKSVMKTTITMIEHTPPEAVLY